MTLRVSTLAMLLTTTGLFAQVTKEEAAKKQAATALDAIKRAELKGTNSADTAELMLYTTLPEARAKTIVANAQKTFDAANKVLKFNDKDKLWPGKLTVFLIAERRDFLATKRTLFPEDTDKRLNTFAMIRSEEPFLLLGADAGVKPTDAEWSTDVGEAVASAMIDHKSGVNPGIFDLPPWYRNGFGKAMVLRTEGNAAKLTAHKAKVKALTAKGKTPMPKASDAWMGMPSKDQETLTTSLVEYFHYGLEPDKYARFIAGLKPNEQVMKPTVEQSLAAMEWKPEDVDAAWKAWLAKQK